MAGPWRVCANTGERHTINVALRFMSGVLDLSVDVTREGSVEAEV